MTTCWNIIFIQQPDTRVSAILTQETVKKLSYYRWIACTKISHAGGNHMFLMTNTSNDSSNTLQHETRCEDVHNT